MRQVRRRWLVLGGICAVVVAAGVSAAAVAGADSHRRSSQPDAEEHEEVIAAANSATGSCGVERWSVKTGTDVDAGKITLNSTTPTTIGSLVALPAPSSLPANNRVQPTETTVYKISATLTEYKLEADSDYHLVLSDPSASEFVHQFPVLIPSHLDG
jgi:hypothetical protein